MITTALSFVFSIAENKILFSSKSIAEYFDQCENYAHLPPFFPHQGVEWGKCLTLQRGQTTIFFLKTQKGLQQLTFEFQATALYPDMAGGNPVLLCNIIESPNPATNDHLALRKQYDEFLALAGHDLDAPLRKLTMLVDRLNDKFLHALPESAAYMERVQTCLVSMRALVNSLNSVAESNAALKFETCDLASIVQTILTRHSTTGNSNPFKWEMGSLPLIYGDKQLLTQLFEQLINNALIFQPENSQPFIKIRNESLDLTENSELSSNSGKNFCKIVVADNGMGIATKQTTRIFDPFVRLNGQSEFPGTGIGLYLCSKIVELHGGRIYAEENQPSGTRFILFLPSPDYQTSQNS